MYWGKYVAHDNNRDGMGQYLKLTQNIIKEVLEWHPTILHDLHEAQSYLYVSTGTGPYNTSLDPIAINEWWLLAETEVMEMAKRGVPGVLTYGFYDGWVPNYLFWIALTHNSFGRFYEVQSYGPDVSRESAPAAHRHQPRMVSVRILRCRRSNGGRATTPTSRNRRCCSRCTRWRKIKSCIWKITGSRTSAPSTKARTVRLTPG